MPKRIFYAGLQFNSARDACQHYGLKEQRFSAFCRRWWGNPLWNHDDPTEQFILFYECWNSGEFVYEGEKYLNLWKFLHIQGISRSEYFRIRRLDPYWYNLNTMQRVEMLLIHRKESNNEIK